MADDLDKWLGDLPGKLQDQLSEGLEDIAGRLADDIRRAAPTKTGKLRSSVRVMRGRNALEFFVVAGGDETTKEVRVGSGIASDYALHIEFGTQKMPAYPFFYSTYRAQNADIRDEINDLVASVLSKS